MNLQLCLRRCREYMTIGALRYGGKLREDPLAAAEYNAKR